MERRDFLALAASVPLLAVPASADTDPDSGMAESHTDEADTNSTDTVEIDVRLT